jgi:hypothetical protein
MKGISAFSVLLLVVLFLQSGCDSNYENLLETQKVINVSGRVKGGNINWGLPGAKIRIEDKMTYTDENGYFNLAQVNTPYTVYITDSLFNSGCIYDVLTESDCRLSFSLRRSITEYSGTIHYNYTGSAASNAKKLFFTDGKNVSGVGETSPSYCDVYLPDNTPVTGRAYLLLYTKNPQGNIVSYDKFGYIDNVVTSRNSTTNLTFTDSICNITPGSVRVSGTINIPDPQVHKGVALSAIYFSQRMFSAITTNLQLDPIYENTFDILIPANLGVEIYPMIWVEYHNQTTFADCKSFYSLPKTGGTGLTLNIPQTPEIINPSELSNINENTIISCSYPGEHIIYKYSFTDSVKTVIYYTRSNQVSLANMSKLGLGSFSNSSTVTFTVTALGQFDYLDDYVNTNRNNLQQSTSFPVSRKYIFNP